jgi:hypothetical protein
MKNTNLKTTAEKPSAISDSVINQQPIQAENPSIILENPSAISASVINQQPIQNVEGIPLDVEIPVGVEIPADGEIPPREDDCDRVLTDITMLLGAQLAGSSACGLVALAGTNGCTVSGAIIAGYTALSACGLMLMGDAVALARNDGNMRTRMVTIFSNCARGDAPELVRRVFENTNDTAAQQLYSSIIFPLDDDNTLVNGSIPNADQLNRGLNNANGQVTLIVNERQFNNIIDNVDVFSLSRHN